MSRRGRRVGTVGRLHPDLEIKIVDGDGRIVRANAGRIFYARLIRQCSPVGTMQRG
jgi:hypothetical protein